MAGFALSTEDSPNDESRRRIVGRRQSPPKSLRASDGL